MDNFFLKNLIVKEFQWDKGNHLKNLKKHDVSNFECEEVFFNQPLINETDEGHSIDEARYSVLGKTSDGRRLFVVFTIRGKKIRVISARDMNRKERSIYEKAEESYSEIQE
ncbi:MAG: BrnT family toxin [Chlorobiales bacterium]|nr:BrnT family toxin [Chlorobiales bacterium]